MKHTFKNQIFELEYDTDHHMLWAGGTPRYMEELHLEPRNGVGKSSKPKIIRLKMGHQCNIGCSYCLQEPLGNKRLKPIQFKPEAMPDMSEVERIELWGGEPLLYWETMQEIIAYYDRPGIEWMTVTNGILLRKKHIQYMQSTKGHWNFAFSHDGPGQKTLRNPRDPLDNLMVLEALEEIKRSPNVDMMFNCTLSDQNHDVFEILTHLEQFGFPVNFELITGYDAESGRHVIQGDNLTRHYDSMFRAIEHPWNVEVSIKDFAGGVHPVIDAFRTKQFGGDTWGCGLDHLDLVSMDLDGGLIVCPNVEHSYGDTSDMEGSDIGTVVNLERRRKCTMCPVVRLCKGGCPLNDEQINCDARFYHYLPILEAAVTIGLKQTANPIRYDGPARGFHVPGETATNGKPPMADLAIEVRMV